MGEGEEGEFHDANANAVEEENEEEEEAGGAIDPQASPDGKWVAFVRRGELYVVPLEEEGLRLVETATVGLCVEDVLLGGGGRFGGMHTRIHRPVSVLSSMQLSKPFLSIHTHPRVPPQQLPSSMEEGGSLDGGALRLTWGADEKEGRTHGLAEFIAQVRV